VLVPAASARLGPEMPMAVMRVARISLRRVADLLSVSGAAEWCPMSNKIAV